VFCWCIVEALNLGSAPMLIGPYEVKTVTYGGVVQLKYLGGTELRGMINGSQLKLYRDSRPPST
jgi:hypothetical protein